MSKQSTLIQQLHSAPAKDNNRSIYWGLVLIAATGCLGIASTSVHAATAAWSPERVIANTSQATNIRTAVNADGTAVTVWDQYIAGSADATHIYGRWQVYGSVCTPQPAPQAPNCSAPQAFTGAGSLDDATNAGAVVAPSGAVTVFWNSFAAPTAFSASSTSSDAGSTWSAVEVVPGDAGYTLLAGVYAEVGPSVGVDGQGNIIVAMINPPTTTPIASAGYSVQTLVKDNATGIWSTPLQLSNSVGIFGSAKLFVNSDGQALLNMGFTSFRRDTAGNWGLPQTVSTVGMGQIYSASAGFDAGGKAYFIYRTRYGGAYMATSTPTSGWTTPKHIAKFDTLGQNALVRGSGVNRAIVYGVDILTNGMVRAAVTTDGGATWGPLVNLGTGLYPRAAGSENGLYVVSWDSSGVNGDRLMVASGTGIGTGTAAWVKKNMIGNFASGPAAIAARATDVNAQAIAGWVRMSGSGSAVGAALGTVAP